jgi:uncharacterized protein (TIGR03435 family)
MKALVIAAIGLAVLPCAWSGTLAFEVASIKPAPPPTGKGLSVRVSQDKGRITMTNVSLRDVLTHAFNVKVQQLNTPDWMESTRFDITAKLPEGANKDQVPEMLRTMLAERFQLTTHKESKVMPVYALIVAKGGPKLKEFPGEGGLNTGGSAKGRTMKGKVSMSTLADSLSGMLDRPVVDMTEIHGSYEVDLAWAPEETPRDPGDSKAGDAPDGPTVFTALQEKMGLKLEARKAPMDIIVVDHAEKVPSEN